MHGHAGHAEDFADLVDGEQRLDVCVSGDVVMPQRLSGMYLNVRTGPYSPRLVEDDLLTDAEAAAELRKHPRTIRRWCQAGRLPGAFKAGRSWRIPRSALPAPRLADLAQTLGSSQLHDRQTISALATTAAGITRLTAELERWEPSKDPRERDRLAYMLVTARRLKASAGELEAAVTSAARRFGAARQ